MNEMTRVVTIDLHLFKEHLANVDMLIESYRQLMMKANDAIQLADIVEASHHKGMDALTDYILDGNHDQKYEAGLIKAYEIVKAQGQVTSDDR